MRKLGYIRLALAMDKYQVQFQYATPLMIDFFALTLMEIIMRKEQFNNKSFADVLLMLEIPADLHNIFEDRLHTLMNEYPEMITSEYNNAYCIDDIVTYFDLTSLGFEAFLSKEMIEETKPFSEEFIYEHTINQLLTIRKANFQIESEALVIDTRNNETEDILIEKFTKIITNQISKFISTANNKTRIFDMNIIPTNFVYLRDNVELNLENNKLIFTHKSPTILNEFLKLPQNEKNEIRSKMFLYLNVPYNHINMEFSSIATPRSKPLKMKVIFGKERVLKEEIYEKGIIEWNSSTKVYDFHNEEMFVFAGITENGKTLVLKYSESEVEGYTIPLIHEDYEIASYLKVFNDIYDQYKEDLSDKETIKFILSIAPEDKFKELVISIATQNKNSDEIVNLLLSINETATIEILGLNKLYNQLLEGNNIKSISHNSNLFALYSDYGRQLEKLKNLGFENYYSYTPTNWDSFLLEVRVLISFFEKFKDKLTQEYKKSVNDFFNRVEEDYYDLAPIQENSDFGIIITENWQNDLKEAINSSKPNFLALAAIIRSKYSEQLLKLEKQIDPNSNNFRKGKNLIEFTLKDYDKINKVYSSWRSLCILVHPETSSEHKLMKGSDNDRKDALRKSIDVFEKFLSNKTESIQKNKSKKNKKKK
jgi:hypothetical protein